MADTLRFMWLWFMDRLDEARRPGGSDLASDHNGAAVEMRLRDYVDDAGQKQRFLGLTVDGPDAAFRLKGSFSTDPAMHPNADDVAWELAGDHEALCEWMLPWVALHVEQGGGYIDFDG